MTDINPFSDSATFWISPKRTWNRIGAFRMWAVVEMNLKVGMCRFVILLWWVDDLVVFDRWSWCGLCNSWLVIWLIDYLVRDDFGNQLWLKCSNFWQFWDALICIRWWFYINFNKTELVFVEFICSLFIVPDLDIIMKYFDYNF